MALAYIGLLLYSVVYAQQTPYFEFTWNEGDGAITIPAADLEQFGQTIGRVEVDWTPGRIGTGGPSQQIFDVPNRLGLWIWADGIHGEWFDDIGNARVFRSRWGLVAVGVEVKIIITWDSAGYAVIINGVTRIHDWQVEPASTFPDPNVVDGMYGSGLDGSKPASGSFSLRVYNLAEPYDACSVDTVGTINQGLPDNNTGAWDQGIDPICFVGTGSITLTWVAPTENTDNTALTDLAGYNIFHSRTSGSGYTAVAENIPPNVISYIVGGLVDGTHYFVATAFNEANVESGFSNEAVRVIDPPPGTMPMPPTNLTVQALAVFTIIKRTDRFVLVVVGTVPPDTACDSTQSVNGHNVVPNDAVIWATETGPRPIVVVAQCG